EWSDWSYGPGRAGLERSLHPPFRLVVAAEQVADLVLQYRQQVHPALFALITRCGELGVLPRGGIDEPAPPGRVVVQPDGVARRHAEGEAAQVGDADLDALEGRRVGAGGLPAGQRLRQERLHQPGAEGIVHRRGGRGRGHERFATWAGQRPEVVVRDVPADLPAHLLSDGNVETPVNPGVDPALAALLRRFRERFVRPLYPH